jgi:methylase of polypeptide subunit release factors
VPAEKEILRAARAAADGDGVGRAARIGAGRRGSIRLRVAPGVHPPDPYAATMAAALRIRRGDRVLDMGCGAGGYGLAAALRGAGRLVLTDTDPAAVDCALANAARNGLPGVEGRVGSLFEPVRGEEFDAIITALPQLPAPRPVIETRYGGPDGLRLLRRLAARAADFLAPGGRLYILVTDWAYPPRVLPLFEARGFAVRRAARVERAFQPAEYDRIAPGLFDYLDQRARRGLAAYRRDGRWCYLGVSLFEATGA